MLNRKSSLRYICTFFVIVIISAFGYGASGGWDFGPTLKEAAVFSNNVAVAEPMEVFGGAFSVTATAGNTSGSYSSLKSLFDAINAGVHQGTITVTMTSDSVESVSAVLNGSGTGASSYLSILIKPNGARTLSGSINGNMVDLNGADNVTIDGLNAGGNSLTISNVSTGTAVSTICFENDATSNTVTNSTVLGSTQATLGVVYFAAGAQSGNDNNVISNNNIGPAGANLPINGIYSSGSSSTVDNSGNTVSGNNIFDYFNTNSASSGINVDTNNSGWAISNNRLYQTATRTYQVSNTHSGIRVASGTGYTISGNVIGFASSGGTGVYTMASANNTITTRFVGINLAADATVQGNTFASISITTIGINTDFGSLCGVNITAGNVNIGNITPNTFGATTGTGSLMGTPLGTIAAGIVGVNTSTAGTVVISNNMFGSFTSAEPSVANRPGAAFGIDVSGAAASLTITGNTIGNNTPDNIRSGTAGVTTGSSLGGGIAQSVPPSVYNYSNNIIRNISCFGASAGYVRGIQTGITAPTTQVATINNNTITNLTSSNALPGILSGNTAVEGIQFFAGVNSTISGNTISNLSSTFAGSGNSPVVAGIVHATGTNNVISNNRIWGLSNASTSASTTQPNAIAGIIIRSGTNTVTVTNNMISLGAGQGTNSSIYGIWANHGSTPDPTTDRIYFNSVDIEGAAPAGAAAPTAAFHRGDLSAGSPKLVPVDVRNNIFVNNRTGGNGKHYAIANHINATGGSVATGWGSVNDNVLNANPATIGYWSTDQTFSGWQSASAGDTLSFSGIPVNFVNSATDLHLNMGTTQTPLESGGVMIAGFTTDIDGQTRPGPAGSVNGGAFAPDLGADEFDGRGTILATPSPTPTATSTSTATSTPTAMPTCVPQPSGLVSWYRAQGNANDNSGVNNGTLQGGTTFVPGEVGQAFSFGGVNDSVVVTNSPSLQFQNFSMDAWIQRNNDITGPIFGSAPGGYQFGVFGNDLPGGNVGGGTQFDGGLFLSKRGINHVHSGSLVVPLDGAMHHVAVTKSGSTVTFYVDGAASATVSYDPGFTFTGDFVMGGSTFALNLDELDIFDRPLAAGEVTGIFNAGSQGKCGAANTGGVAIWDGTTGNWSDGSHWSSTPFFPNNASGIMYDAVENNGSILLDQNINIQKFNFLGGTFGNANAFGLTLNDLFTWGGGDIQGNGIIQANGGMNINGNLKSISARTLNNGGAAIWTMEAPIGMGNGAIFNNQANGTFTTDFDGAVYDTGGAMSQFNNAGTFTKSSGGSAGGSTSFSMPFTNSGTVHADGGTILFNGGFTQTGGTLSLGGNNISSPVPFMVQGGQVVGNGTIDGSLFVSGATIAPGFSVGTVVINGSLTLGPNATYICQIDSSAPLGKIVTTGAADKIVANGVMIGTNTGLSTPDIGRGLSLNTILPIGTVFVIIDNTSGTPVSGEFANLPEGSIFVINGNTFNLSYMGGTGNDVTLTFVGVAGTVTYGNAIPAATRFVSNVLISGVGSPNVSAVTGGLGPNAGQYLISGFGTGSYTFTPSKTGGLNGSISSFDAAKIAQHAAGTSTLTGNALIVADVSGTNGVTSFDAAEVARFAAGFNTQIGASGTWRFTPVSNTHASIGASISGENYTALLMGEVSGNWANTGARVGGMRSGPEKRVSVTAPHVASEADNEVVIPVTVDGADDKEIISYEFDLRYDPAVIQPQANPVELAGTVSGKLWAVANAEAQGLLRVVVYGATPIKDNGVLLNLKFAAIGAPGSASPLTWERMMLNEGDPRMTATDGQVELLAKTPTQGEIDGRLLTTMGQGVPNARVTLTDTAGQARSIVSNGFGVYRLGGLQIGQTYTISVESRGFRFTPLTVSVTEQQVSIDMIAVQ